VLYCTTHIVVEISTLIEIAMNFGPQTKKFYWLTLSHPSGLFGGDYISIFRGCCSLKVLYALKIDSAYPNGKGVPQKLFIVKI